MNKESKHEEGFTPKKLMVIIVEVILIVIIALVAVALIQAYLLTSIEIVGNSMAPTIDAAGAKVFINKAAKEYKRGDVIVTYVPVGAEEFYSNPSLVTQYGTLLGMYANDEAECPASRPVTFTDFIRSMPFVNQGSAGESAVADGYKRVIKRVVGIPGDTVAFIEGKLYVNNELDARAELYDYPGGLKLTGNGSRNYAYTLGAEEYFIMGDNRSVSIDSEDYGPIKSSWIEGKVVLLITAKGKWEINF